jgi:rSAM/selenodomain-associated transferase 1
MEKHSHFFDNIALIVLTKTLDVPVKTRIARTEGTIIAQKIYRELLDATADTIKDLPYYVAFTGSDSPGMLTSVFSRAISFFPQTGEDLGSRMKRSCLHCNALGSSGFIVIGCDCPERTSQDIIDAAQNLKKGDNVVVGPVSDGGYHLAGADMKGLTIFDATKWSTGELMEETLAIIRFAGLKSSLLPVRHDIDTIEDYRQWKSRAGLLI